MGCTSYDPLNYVENQKEGYLTKTIMTRKWIKFKVNSSQKEKNKKKEKKNYYVNNIY